MAASGAPSEICSETVGAAVCVRFCGGFPIWTTTVRAWGEVWRRLLRDSGVFSATMSTRRMESIGMPSTVARLKTNSWGLKNSSRLTTLNATVTTGAVITSTGEEPLTTWSVKEEVKNRRMKSREGVYGGALACVALQKTIMPFSEKVALPAGFLNRYTVSFSGKISKTWEGICYYNCASTISHV